MSIIIALSVLLLVIATTQVIGTISRVLHEDREVRAARLTASGETSLSPLVDARRHA